MRGIRVNPGPAVWSLLTGILLAATPACLSAQGLLDRFRDPNDGSIDASAWMATAHGFLPVFSIVTEPAVGYGIAGGATFFHRKEGWTLEEGREAFRTGQRQSPPSVSAPGGMYTLGGSWVVGGGHRGIWKNDRIRYQGGGGFGSFELAVVGTGDSSADKELPYTIEGWGLVQSLAFRISDLDLFWGIEYRIVGSEVTFDTAEIDPDLNVPGSSFRTAGLGFSLLFDSRNNTFTPDRGLYLKTQLSRQDHLFGGEADYWSGYAYGLFFTQPVPSWVLGLRLEGRFAQEASPFWDLPSVGMRGIPAMKYIGQQMALTEAEVRWDLTSRWSLLAFGGVGWTWTTRAEEDLTRKMESGGMGFRYLLARAFGLRAGIDVAYSHSGWAWYTTIGSAWLK